MSFWLCLCFMIICYTVWIIITDILETVIQKKTDQYFLEKWRENKKYEELLKKYKNKDVNNHTKHNTDLNHSNDYQNQNESIVESSEIVSEERKLLQQKHDILKKKYENSSNIVNLLDNFFTNFLYSH